MCAKFKPHHHITAHWQGYTPPYGEAKTQGCPGRETSLSHSAYFFPVAANPA
jgi:hypothetical protein